MVVTSDQSFGDVHLLDRLRLEVGLREKRGQVEVGLEADVNRERRDQALDARENRVRAEKVVEQDDAAARAADAPHLPCATLTGSGTTLMRYGA